MTINEKKEEIITALQELQAMYDDTYGKRCQLSVDIDYVTMIPVTNEDDKLILSKINILCQVNM